MDRAELAETVRGRIAQIVGVSADEITEGTDLRGEYEVDSLELMELGTRLENSLGIRLAAEDLVALRTVGDAIDRLHVQLRDRV